MKLVGEKQLIWEPRVKRKRAKLSLEEWRNIPQPRINALQKDNYISGIAVN